MSKDDDNDRSSGSDRIKEVEAIEQEYKVGPGRPPKEYQFKPGESGNPKGAKRKEPTLALDLKAALQEALNNKVKLKQGEKERMVTMAAAGIEQLVAQYVKGDHRARRDLIALTDRLGVDLVAGQQHTIHEALAADHATILKAYVDRQRDNVVRPTRAFAPDELLDDDPQDQKEE